MNFSDETVARCCDAARQSSLGLAVRLGRAVTTATNLGNGEPTIEHADWYAKAALQSLTLADLMQVAEVRELVLVAKTEAKFTSDKAARAGLDKALTPFTGAK